MDLSKRQLDTLRHVASGIASGLAPTIRELGDVLGIRSTNAVNDHLLALEKKGYLLRDRLKSRAIRLTDKAREYLGMATSLELARAELLEEVYIAVKKFQMAPIGSRAAALGDLDAAVERLRVHDAGRAAA